MRGRVFVKLYVILPVILLLTLEVSGQTHEIDSLKNDVQDKEVFKKSNPNTDSIQQSFRQRSDSLQQTYTNNLNKLDSIENAIHHENIIQKSNHKVDSIQSSFHQSADSLKNAYKSKLSKLDAARTRLQNKVDSLTTRKLPTTGVTQKLDSINTLRQKTITSFEKKVQSLKDQTTKKIKKLDLPPEINEKVASVTKNIDDIKIPTSELNLPSTNIASNPLGKDNPLQSSGLNGKVNELKVPGGMGEIDQLKIVNQNAGDVSKVTGQAGDYTKDADGMIKGNINEVKELPKVAEEKVAKASGVNELNKDAALDEYKSMAGKTKDPEALKKEATEKAKQVAVNHFAGKEEQLKAAMEKVSKYKQKYSSMKGISDLSKKPRNQMHDKPLIERIVPGLALQFQKKGEDFLVDFNPYAGYRFTTKLRAGVGWNQRLAYTFDQKRFSPDARIYGPRVFGEYKLGKGFSPRAEIEVMNTRIPPLLATIDPSKREWIWGAFVGMKKEYKLIKNVKGTAMVMARIINPQHKSPYADVLNVRMGFEFPMKKKVKR